MIPIFNCLSSSAVCLRVFSCFRVSLQSTVVDKKKKTSQKSCAPSTISSILSHFNFFLQTPPVVMKKEKEKVNSKSSFKAPLQRSYLLSRP